MEMSFNKHDLLQRILSQPTAPFREGHVISEISSELDKYSVPHFLDPLGNLVVGVASRTEYLKALRKKDQAAEPMRVFIAHMDHPGFHGLAWKTPEGKQLTHITDVSRSACELEITWHGGSPTVHLEGAQVWLANNKGWWGSGRLRNPRLLASGRALESASVVVDSCTAGSESKTEATSLYGGFQFRAPIWKEGEILYTKAADDLVGSYAIAALAIETWQEAYGKGVRRKSVRRKAKISHFSPNPPFLGLLTRAEEVGFVGAIGHFELGWLNQSRRPIICISLETSRTLAGAEIGKGPVVRLGDRFTVFDPGALSVFTQLAHSILPEKHQRRIMDGGTCEATAATVFGFPSVGISVPLGNYHNQSLEGGPDSAPMNGPAPEFVHVEDIEGLIQLCHGLLQPKLPWADPWKTKLKELKKGKQNYRHLLRTGP